MAAIAKKSKKMPIGDVLAVVFGLATAGAISLIIRDKWSFLNPPTRPARPTPVKKSKVAYAYDDSIMDDLGDIEDVALPSGIGAPALDFSKSNYVPGRPDPPAGGNRKLGTQDPAEVQPQSDIEIGTDDITSFDTGVLNFLPGVGADVPGAGEVGIPEQTTSPDTYSIPTHDAGGWGHVPEGGQIYPQTSNEQMLKNELAFQKNPKNPKISCVIDGKKVKGWECLDQEKNIHGSNPAAVDKLGNIVVDPGSLPFQTTDVETFYASSQLAVAYND